MPKLKFLDINMLLDSYKSTRK